MKEIICTSPFFGITVSIAAYSIGVMINRKTRLALFNPLLVSYLIIIPLLLLFDIPLEWYDRGGDIINMFLSPATAVLAITLVLFLCRLFALPGTVTASLIPKSITTPLAIAVCDSLGGIQALTVLAVIVTGITGSIIAPPLIKLFRIRSEIAQGLAIGAASHAVGTSKAVEMGDVQGALSSVSLVMSGVITVLISIIFFS